MQRHRTRGDRPRGGARRPPASDFERRPPMRPSAAALEARERAVAMPVAATPTSTSATCVASTVGAARCGRPSRRLEALTFDADRVLDDVAGDLDRSTIELLDRRRRRQRRAVHRARARRPRRRDRRCRSTARRRHRRRRPLPTAPATTVDIAIRLPSTPRGAVLRRATRPTAARPSGYGGRRHGYLGPVPQARPAGAATGGSQGAGRPLGHRRRAPDAARRPQRHAARATARTPTPRAPSRPAASRRPAS